MSTEHALRRVDDIGPVFDMSQGEDAEGKIPVFMVKDCCILCEACSIDLPEAFQMPDKDGGDERMVAIIIRQPQDRDELEAIRTIAREVCPVDAVHEKTSHAEPDPPSGVVGRD